MAQIGATTMLAGLTWVPSLGLAEPPPSQCASSESIRARVMELLDAPIPSGTSVRVRPVEPDDDHRLRVDVEVPDRPESHRVVTGETCSALIETAAVFVAVTVLPMLPDDTQDELGPQLGRPQPRVEASTVDAAQPATPTQRPEDARTTDARRQPPAERPTLEETLDPRPSTRAKDPSIPFTWSIGLGLALEGGSLPGIGPGVALAAAGRKGPVRLALRAAYFTPRARMLESQPEKGGRFALAQVGADRSYALALAPISVFGCGGIEGGLLTGQGLGVDRPEESETLLAAGRAGVRVGLPLGDVIVPFVSVSGAFAFIRRRFSLESYGRVHDPGPLSFGGTVGLELRL